MNKNLFKLSYANAFLIIVIFVLSNLVLVIPNFIDKSFFDENKDIDYLLLFQIVPFIFTFIAIHILFNVRRDNIKVETKTPTIAIFFTSIALFFSTLMFNEYFIGLIPTDGIFKELYDEFTKTFNSLKPFPVTLVFATCILAPLLEEILFRGILLRGLLNNKINPTYAIVYTSFLFGLVHGNPWQFVGGFTLGLALGYIYYKTESLVNVIWIHAINNSIAAYILIMLDRTEVQEIEGISFIGALAILLFIFALGTLLHLLTRKTKKSIKIV